MHALDHDVRTRRVSHSFFTAHGGCGCGAGPLACGEGLVAGRAGSESFRFLCGAGHAGPVAMHMGAGANGTSSGAVEKGQ